MDTCSLIAHVHVPKTAGTTINGALEAAFGPGQHHVEGIIDNKAVFADAARNSPWVAGHVPAPRLRAELEGLGLSARYITALREPVSHVASHYNWLIEIGNRGEAFLNGHPAAIIEIHKRIKNSDNTDPNIIIQNLEKNPRLFLNCQSGYVLGPDLAVNPGTLAISLDRFTGLVFSDDLKGGLSTAIPNISFDGKTENASAYHFDRSIFDDPKILEFLAERNQNDSILWEYANEKYRSSDGGIV